MAGTFRFNAYSHNLALSTNGPMRRLSIKSAHLTQTYHIMNPQNIKPVPPALTGIGFSLDPKGTRESSCAYNSLRPISRNS